MNFTETGAIMDILKTAYPYFYNKKSVEEETRAVKLWAEMFSEIPLEAVAMAVKRLILTHEEFPPTIGQVMKSCMSVCCVKEPDFDEVWGVIMVAIRKHGVVYNHNECAAYITEKIPIAKKLLESISLRQIGLCEEAEDFNVLRSNAMKIYATIVKRSEEEKILPREIRDFMLTQKAATSTSVEVNKRYLPDKQTKFKLTAEEAQSAKENWDNYFGGLTDIRTILSAPRKDDTLI